MRSTSNFPPHTPFSAPFSKSAGETRLRIYNLFRWKKKRPPLLILIFLCFLTVCCGSLVSCRNSTQQAQNSTIEPAITGAAEVTTPTQGTDSAEQTQSQGPDLNPFFSWDYDSMQDLLQSGARFNGNRISNPRELDMDYSILNGTFTHTLKLRAGDNLSVDLSVDEGTLGIVIQRDNAPIYSNDDLDTSSFSMEITQSGDYQVTITGGNTKGSIHMKV